MKKYKKQLIFLLFTVVIMTLAVWGPETLAQYKDRTILNQIMERPVETGTEGYRYSLSSNEKLYLLAKCLNSQILPESEQNAMTRADKGQVDYQELPGTYAFVVNRQETDSAIEDGEIFEQLNQELAKLKELGILPDEVKKVNAASYSAVQYSAIDVPEPRNNVLVWKVSLATRQQNANKENRLLDAYMDADTGKIYEFYVRTELTWEEIDPDAIITRWSEYLGLSQPQSYEPVNPLLETTPNFRKYVFEGMEDGTTVVTIGFYEGINELFLKISR